MTEFIAAPIFEEMAKEHPEVIELLNHQDRVEKPEDANG